MQHQTVLILDYGSQFTQLIARRVRELSIYCEIVPFHQAAEAVARRPAAIILSGGPASVTEAEAPDLPAAVLEAGIPVLGICYGLQVLTRTLGGRVEPSAFREYGRAHVHLDDRGGLFARVQAPLPQVWMSHGDHVAEPAPGFAVVARSADGIIAAVADPGRRLYGVQFHPEVVHTAEGGAMLAAFLHDIAGLAGDWTPASFIEDAIARIRAQVGDGRVICGLSGGVDSAVAAALLHAAIGDRLTCVFVDNGLLRQGEAKQVVETFGGRFGYDLRFVDATD
ncbi:MAG: glutamine-hydrolyzing GMP synthase, partial [bacterium]